MKKVHALVHASEILTGAGIRAKDGRRVADEDIGRIEDGAVVYEMNGKMPGRVLWVGKTAELPKKYSRAKKKDLKNSRAVTAGWVDCHTHLIFAGDRSVEFARRCGGATYREIAAEGGGIQTTVRATRAAKPAELERLAEARLREAWAFGVRTIEIKSGYGLSHESELAILKIVPKLKKKFPELTIRTTFLGAHDFPKDQDRASYLREILERMLPAVAKGKLADACDIFIDEGFYTIEEGRKILGRAKDLGLPLKIHADELADTGSAALAAELGALSADHLLRINDEGVKALAGSSTVAVLLPGTAFYLKAPHAPARKLLAAGARVAISTDFNPGTSMTLSLPTVMTISALYLGMSRAEILAAVTHNAAAALGLEKRKGAIAPGLDADFTILPFARFEEAYYRFAWAPRDV